MTSCMGTGQRPNAAIQMRHDDFWGEWMRVVDEKGDESHEVYCPIRLRNFLASVKKRGAYLIARNLTQPKGYNSVEGQFRAWRKTLGDAAQEYTLHGLRKLACVQLAEANCGDALIQAVTGQSPKTVAYYRRLADKKKLSKKAQMMRDQNKNKT